jgi:HSP20 family protein
MRRTQALAPFFGFTPFNAMRRFTDEFEKMFDEFNSFDFALDPFAMPALPGFSEIEASSWLPQIEVFEKKGQFIIRIDLPGMKRDDISVEFLNNALLISGERTSENEEERDNYYRSEREYGSFLRNIPLPEGADIDSAKATFDNGVLEVALQVPARQKKGRKLEIAAKHEPVKAKAAGR